MQRLPGTSGIVSPRQRFVTCFLSLATAATTSRKASAAPRAIPTNLLFEALNLALSLDQLETKELVK